MEDFWQRIERSARERQRYFTVTRPNPKLVRIAADTERVATERKNGNHAARTIHADKL